MGAPADRDTFVNDETATLVDGQRPGSLLFSSRHRCGSLVYATALSDPAGYASAVYGVARKCLRWGAWVENQPHWFVIDRKGTITLVLEPKFDTPTAYEKDVDLVLEALKKAAR